MNVCTCKRGKLSVAPAPDGSEMHQRGCPALNGNSDSASVIAHPDSVNVNGLNLTLLSAEAFIKAKSSADIRFIVMPAPEHGCVLLTFGHAASKEQFFFALAPSFAEDLGQTLIRASRQLAGVVKVPGAPT